MTDFVFQPTVPARPGSIISAALGPDDATKFSQADLGKPVKLDADNNYVLCVENDEIEGFVESIEPNTVNDGFSFGSVNTANRHIVEVAVGETVAVGNFVLADAQAALGTAGMALVKPGVAASQAGVDPFAYTERAPNTFMWRCVSLLAGAGAAGNAVLIERV